MFKKGEWYQNHRKLLKHRLGTNTQAYNDASLRRMVEVEYGLRLMQILNLLNEPIISLPDLLTLHELPALRHFTDGEWQLLMFARCRIPNYLSHQRWRDDLREYAMLPTAAMLFGISKELSLDEQVVGQLNKKLELADHLSAYDDLIKARPPYQRSTYNPASAGAIYYFDVYPDKSNRRHPVSISLPEDLSISAPLWYAKVPKTTDDASLERFIKSQQKEQRKPIVLNWESHIVAESRLMQAQDPVRKWEKRIGEMRLNNETSDGDLVIDGQVHLVGMVGAGKSTLVKTIAHHLVRTSEEIRIAVIVPSTMDAFSFANEINEILACDWDKPAAVAYFGWTGRDKHIRAFLNEYGNQPKHFGHRWVSQSCAAMSLMPVGEMANLQSAPRPGSEPCETLADSPLRPESEDIEAFKAPERNTSCPFIAQCPSHQKLRDLKSARIIVTTAGALQSRLPVFFDPRRLLLADYIYEQTDLVFVDEADEVQAFEDDLFVNMVPLWNHPQALFYATDASVSAALRQDALSEIEENWAFSVRDGAKYILPILRTLHQTGNSSLRTWIGRSYFSAYRLFQTIARRMIGLPDWVSPHDMNPVETERYELLSAIFSLLTAHDMTKLPDVDLASEQEILRFGSQQVVRYACKLRDILARAVANIPRQFEEELLRLMEAILSDLDLNLDESLAKLEDSLRETDAEKPRYLPADERETKQSLAHKLMFCLLAAGLDREIRALVYNSDAQPSAVSSVVDIRDFNPNFRSTHTGLPTAYTGSVFGTYYSPDERRPEQNKGDRGEQEVLARLEYVNPGRELLLRYHELYRLFGIHGPHVVFLSGTSYLPDSSRWHIRTPIGAVLEANPQWSDTIQSLSEYFFSPALSKDKRPIRVSGAGETSDESNLSKDEALREIARYWAEKKTLEKQLLDLEERGRALEVWSDRSRLLLFVNSYDQAQILGKAIRQHSSLKDEEVQWLTPSDDEKRFDGVSRASIESVASSQLRVLVAPLSAIGRGHNILTVDKSKAAFGAAYFVVRPLNPPGDVNGIAAEINCYGAQWLDKNKPSPHIAQKQYIFQQETELRRLALEHWHKGERRSYYKHLSAQERHDLGATSLGRFVQAAGRLVRGGVPMLVHFVDAAWAPISAERQLGKHRKNDTPETSLLVEMICRLAQYTRPEDKYGRILYQPFTPMFQTNGLYYSKEKCNEKD
jgi:hypothetical protein